MKTIINYFCFFVICILASKAIAADYGHIHLTAPDAKVAAQWYAKHFNGEVGGFGGQRGEGVEIDRVYFGDIPIVFFEREPSAGSVGSGVDHIGFSIANVELKVQTLIDDGAQVNGEKQNFRGMAVMFVEDPWGTKIELIDDANMRGLHHIHLVSSNPLATLDWYEKNMGGERSRFADVLPGILYQQKLWLFALPQRDAIVPTQGRSVDHLGWNFGNLDEAAVTLKSNQVKFTMEPRDYRGIRIGFIEGPEGVRIELVQP